MSMEKRGVLDGENEAPKAVEKAAGACDRPKCCKQDQPCGTDPLSKAAEVAANNGIPVTKQLPPL